MSLISTVVHIKKSYSINYHMSMNFYYVLKLCYSMIDVAKDLLKVINE